MNALITSASRRNYLVEYFRAFALSAYTPAVRELVRAVHLALSAPDDDALVLAE